MTKKIWARVLAALLLCFHGSLSAGPAFAQNRQPELMEGKKTLFKRAIARPEATLYTAANEQGGSKVPAFSVFYVYGRSNHFVEVGKSIGAAEGFVKADKLIEWKQSIVAVFNNGTRAERERALLFSSRAALDEVVAAPDMPELLKKLRDAAAAGRPNNEKVAAIEPENPPDIRKNFYFFPILSVADKRLKRLGSKVLQVAALSKIDQPPPTPQNRKRELAEQRVGIMFVVDTTMSMGPYIEKVREAMLRIEDRLKATPVGANSRFGIVGFRQSLADNGPSIEYHTKTFLKLNKNGTADAFVREIAKVKESPVSTKGFNEDSLGGVYEALESADWHDIDLKFIVMMTDAGPLLPESGRALRAPGLGPGQIQNKAREANVALAVIHLLTPEGNSDHASAQAQYLTLTANPQGQAYFPVEGGDLTKFKEGLDRIADGILARANAASSGDEKPPVPSGNKIQDTIERNFYAMQLAYLGRRENSKAPDMFEAYMMANDLVDPSKDVAEIRLFLTKNQLATMHDVAQRIVETGERYANDPSKFFIQLRMAIATLARDPSRRIDTQADKLGAAMGEFLDGLPYAQASPILSMTENDWQNLGQIAQIQMMTDLKRKIRYFEEWHNTADNWVALDRGAPEGETVTAFPLSQLP